ncbi:MAG: hypothetical protein K2W95_27660 [Candidatus Obscuribacterales bacterium]|nr:hypothetical protein [Candidatus Obscuribacterales bacterium]
MKNGDSDQSSDGNPGYHYIVPFALKIGSSANQRLALSLKSHPLVLEKLARELKLRLLPVSPVAPAESLGEA